MNGIVLYGGRDELIEGRAAKYKLPVIHGRMLPLPFDRTLIVRAGTRVPWDWLPAAWALLERWDALVPLWRYDATAEGRTPDVPIGGTSGVGTEEERAKTRKSVRDLRVLLHAVELLFVRRNEEGVALLETWRNECACGRRGQNTSDTSGVGFDTADKNRPPTQPTGATERLAFLRALYAVKPRLCVLPTSWLGGGNRELRIENRRATVARGDGMVRVEISPGQFVKCFAKDEARVRAMFGQAARHRTGENGMAILSSKSFTEMNQKVRAKKGPLVKVEIGPGQYVKMYRADAEEAGLIAPAPSPPAPLPEGRGEKIRRPQDDKIRRPEGDKAAGVSMETAGFDTADADKKHPQNRPPTQPAGAADDFTSIPGVGRATVRMLAARGIETFEDLRRADLGKLGLSAAALKAVEAWRDEK